MKKKLNRRRGLTLLSDICRGGRRKTLISKKIIGDNKFKILLYNFLVNKRKNTIQINHAKIKLKSTFVLSGSVYRFDTSVNVLFGHLICCC